jgi:hypothetical protein
VNLKDTKLRVNELKELATEVAALSNAHISPESQLAMFATMRDVFVAPEAATQMRNVIGRMQTAGGTPAKTKGLAMLGIKSDEVDLVGETYQEAFARLKKGLDGVDEATGNIALGKIFEERGVQGARHLLNNADKLAQREQAIRGDYYETALDLSTQGPAFERNQALARQEQELDRQGYAAHETQRINSRTDQTRQAGALGRGIFDFAYDLPGVSSLPASARSAVGETAVRLGATSPLGALNDIVEHFRGQSDATKEATKELKQAAQRLQQPVVNVQVNVPGEAKPVRPQQVPAANLGRPR